MMNNTLKDEEHKLTEYWRDRLFAAGLPATFTYGGEPFSKTWPSCTLLESQSASGSVFYQNRQLVDTRTGLMISVEIKTFNDFPCIEWVARLKNTGDKDSPLIENLQALDMQWTADRSLCGQIETPVVRYAAGTRGAANDFELMETAVKPGENLALVAKGGKSSTSRMPFFNLHWGEQGIIAMIGWSGQWAAGIAHDADGSHLQLTAGLERTHFILHPGEEIRTPSIALLFWTGALARSHNLLRRFIVKHHSPAPTGQHLTLPVSCPSWGGMKTKNHLKKIEYIQKSGIPITNYWIDAGWFGPPHDAEEYQNLETEDWFGLVGDWRVNTFMHPGGLKVVSDAAHAAGMTFLLWFEPERAVTGTPVTLEHPEWMIPHPPGLPKFDVGKYKNVESNLVNLGIPEARKWITDFISERIEKEGIDVYRQDMNTSLAKYLESCDEPDRVGIAEMKYIEGLYLFTDELLQRHPGLLIDNCAGGGARLDLEMISRSVCLHRTDYVAWPGVKISVVQAQGLNIMHWIPYTCSSLGSNPGDTYEFRSVMSCGENVAIGSLIGAGDVDVSLPDTHDSLWYKKMLSDHDQLKDLFAGDFYPLADCNISEKNWHAFQLDCPEQGRGAIFAFRREQSPFSRAELPLSGLEDDAEYELTDIDTGETSIKTGIDLARQGYELSIPCRRGSRIITYHKT